MSTRCVINFCWGGEIFAKVYRHADGYPDGVVPDLARFFADVEAQTADTRFGDPSYLAAKFVVWQADRQHDSANALDFLGVGVILEDPGDIRFRWFLDCHNRVDGRPSISYEEGYGDEWSERKKVDP